MIFVSRILQVLSFLAPSCLILSETDVYPYLQVNSSSYQFHYTIPSSTVTNYTILDLTSNTVVESSRFCQNISSILNYSTEECLGLTYQSHRTLRLAYYESYFRKYSIGLNHYVLHLAFSYGFETCLPNEYPDPIDVCFFGNISPSVVLLALLSCDSYQIKVYNWNDFEIYTKLKQFRQDFPHRSIQWIYGDYSSYYPQHSPPPHCNIIILDEYSTLEFAEYQNLPIPSPVMIKENTRESDSHNLLQPCRGNGLIIQYQKFDASMTGLTRLTETYKKQGVLIDWRLTSMANDEIENSSILDYEGFPYRFFRSKNPQAYTRFNYGCVSSTYLSPLSRIAPNTFTLHPILSSSLAYSTMSRNPTSLSQQCPNLIISYTNRFFYETAVGLKQAIETSLLQLFGKSSFSFTVSIWYDMNIALLLPSYCSHQPYQIAIAPHEDTLMLKKYIVFNMEQTWSSYMRSIRYRRILQEAQAVWTFTSKHREYLGSLGIDSTSIHWIPIYTNSRYLYMTYHHYLSSHNQDKGVKEGGEGGGEGSAPSSTDLPLYDVLLFGSSSERRIRFEQELIQNISRHSKSFSFYRILSSPQYSLMRDRRDDLVRRSRIILNIHTEESSSLEVHRLNYLLSMGSCVLSERGSDPELDQMYESAVVFAKWDELIETIINLLENEQFRLTMQLTAFNFAANLMSNTTALQQALTSLLSR